MHKFLTILFYFIISLSVSLHAQYQKAKEIIKPGMLTHASSEQPGGRYITSIAENGQYLRVLIIFVQFKDDNWKPDWGEWPKGQAPVTWMGTNFIDQTTMQNSTKNNLTHYYSVMSMGHFKIIGDFQSRITKQTRDEYLSAGLSRKDINKEILQGMNDEGFNFTPYDNWNKQGEYNHIWGADNKVDMIWMIYRNISQDKKDPKSLAIQLGFGDNYSGKYSGEASLGGGGILNVNGGKKIDLGNYGLVSGLTIMEGYNGIDKVKSLLIHEFGHYLLGDNSEHTVWGMLYGYGSRAQVVNSRERYKLGWINLKQYNSNPPLPVPLGDYLTTGDALRIQIPGSNPAKYYYLENHQRISLFDNVDKTSGGKGIYVLYQSGAANNTISFYNAKGRAVWSFDHYAMHPTVGIQVPVFIKGLQNNSTGKFDTESIMYKDTVTGTYKSSTIEAYINPTTGTDVFEPLFAGEGKEALNPGYVEVLSPYSNPALSGVSFQVISENDQLKIKLYVEPGTLDTPPPAKPQNLEVSEYVDSASGSHPKLTWAANLETKVKSASQGYLVERKVGNTPFIQIAAVSGTTTQYIDYRISYASGSSLPIYYRIRAKDTRGFTSVYGDEMLLHFKKQGK